MATNIFITSCLSPIIIRIKRNIPSIPEIIPGLTPNDYWAFMEPTDAPGTTGSTLSTLAARGTAAPVLNLVGSGNAPIKEANAIRFNIGQYFAVDGLTVPAGDGFILAGEFTVNQITGTQTGISLIAANNSILGIVRTANASAQYNVGAGINGTAANLSVGTVTVGQRIKLAIEFDRVAGTVRYWNLATGAVVSQALAYSGPMLPVRIAIGQGANHSIHKVTLVTRATGATWGTTFEEVLADYGLTDGVVQPVPEPEATPFTAMRIHTSTGQSLALGLNMGGVASPSGTVWRTVLQDAQVRMLSGHQRKDGVSVASVSSPLLGGYDTAINAVGDVPAVGVGHVPPSLMSAVARAREGLPEGTGISYQFHGAAGQSVTNLDSSTAEGSTVIPWENFTFSVAQQASYWMGRGVAVSCPVFSYNQGEADAAQPRGWWLERFTILYNETVSVVRAATGQTTGPQLYLYQTGGYMNKVNGHQVVLDQLDAVRNLNGVLVAPIYWQKINNSDNSGVHMGVQGYLQLGELENWAITEIEAGNDWSLMPPVTVERSGSIITIPITVRSDETLTTSPGKYADYGGDPANLGLEVDGGGSITSANVADGNIILNVNGDVTAVRYAMQTTGIDYRTLTDANVEGYATHRGIIRTTLTRTRTVGGLVLTAERAVPSFFVAVTAPALTLQDVAPNALQIMDASTIDQADGTAVTAWADSGTFGRNLIGVGGPIKRTNGIQHWITLDGVNDYLYRNEAIIRPRVQAGSTVTIQMVVRATPGTDRRLVAEGNSAGGSALYGIVQSGNPDNALLSHFLREDTGGSSVGFVSAAEGILAFGGVLRSFAVEDTGSAIRTWVDGVMVREVAYVAGRVMTVNRFALGCLLRGTPSSFFAGDVFAYVINPAPYSADIDAVLRSKAGM